MKTLFALVFAFVLVGQLWAAEPANDIKPYPLNTCIISGSKLGEMGKPYVFEKDGREIKMCCKGCLPEFQKNPAAALKRIDEAEKKAAKAHPYPLNTCLVTGEKLDAMGTPYVFVYEEQEVKLCCKGCLPDFRKEPAKYMKQLQAKK